VSDRKSAPVPQPHVDDVQVCVLFVDAQAGVGVCGGKVGTDNAKFCTAMCVAGTMSCGRYTTHEKKADIEFPAYYIASAKPGVAFLHPRLVAPLGGFSSIIDSSLAGQRTTQEWVEVFSGLKNIDNHYGSDQTDIVARVNRRIALGPTPMLVRKRSASDDLEVDMESLSGIGWTDGDRGTSMLEEGLSVEDAINHMQGHWNGLVRAAQRQRVTTKDLESSVRNLLEEVDDKVVKVAAIMGESQKNAPAVTVWASIGAHTETLNHVVFALKGTKAELDQRVLKVHNANLEVSQIIMTRVLPVVSQLANKVEEMQQSSEGTSGPPRTGLVWEQEHRALSAEHQTLVQEVKAMKASLQLSGHGPVLAAMVNDVRLLEQQYRELKNALQNGLAAGTHSAVGATDVQGLREEMGRLHDEVRAVQLENTKIRAELNTEGISFGGHYFQSPQSYRQFVLDHVPSGYYGFCYDFVSLLECYGDQDRTTDVGLSNLHMVVKTGYQDTQQARIDVSFGTVVPLVFGPRQEANNPSKKMAFLTTLDVWEHPSSASGLKVTIDDFMLDYRSAVESQIESVFGSSSIASLFFLGLLQHTLTFWESYSAWVTKFERDLSHQTGGDDPASHKKTVWSLICWMTHAMFVEMKTRRSPGAGHSVAAIGGDARLKCSKILHGTLAGHKFMSELIAAKFVRHPIFASTMDEFLLKTKASHETLTALQVKVKRLEEGFKGVQASADKALQAAKKAPIK
jgi:hypothetical protein